MDNPTTRCSALPMNFLCPGSMYPEEGEVLIDPVNPAGTMGTACHEFLAEQIVSGGGENVCVTPYALKHGVDEKELGILAWYGRKAWDQLKDHFPHPRVEQELSTLDDWTFTLTGHTDVSDYNDGVVYLLDWKSGRLDTDPYHQMAGYAWLSLFDYPAATKVFTIVAWLRDETYEVEVWTVDELMAWADDFKKTVLDWDGVYRPGGHCAYCRRLNNCPARTAMVRRSVEELQCVDSLVTAGKITVIPDVAMYRKAKLVQSVCDTLINLTRDYIQANGPLDAGDGRELVLAETSRDTIDPEKAWPVITKHLTQEELLPAVSVKKTLLLDAIAAKAARGQKGKDKKKFMRALAEAGAVSSKIIPRLTERRKPEKEQDDGEES